MQDTDNTGNTDMQDQDAFGADLNATPGPEGDLQATHRADNYDSIRATGEAADTAGAGVPGLGGGAGGTPNYAGQGTPGGAHTLGAGAAPSRDAQSSGTSESGGLSVPTGAAVGHTPPTTSTGSGTVDPAHTTSSAPSSRDLLSPEEISEAEARSGTVDFRGGATPSKPGGDAANANPTQGDEAATRARRQSGANDTASSAAPNPGGPMGNPLRPQDAYSPGSPEEQANAGRAGPLTDEPQPGPLHEPGPDAQI